MCVEEEDPFRLGLSHTSALSLPSQKSPASFCVPLTVSSAGTFAGSIFVGSVSHVRALLHNAEKASRFLLSSHHELSWRCSGRVSGF